MLRIGIDLGGTKIEGIVMIGSADIARVRISTPRDDYAATIDAIAEVIEVLERQAGGQASVGIGIPGVVSPQTGLVKNANSVWLNGRPLWTDLNVRLGRDVRIENDANCFAVSEAADGAAVGAEVVFGVIVGTGVGGGIVVRGRPITGPNAIAGEWGHNPLPWPTEDERQGPECYCGHRGCIETFLSGPGLIADHQQHTGRGETAQAIVESAAAGDAGAEAALQRYEERMARALASVINVLDPEVVVLGGGMSNIDRLYESVPRLWTPYVFTARQETVRTRLARARHGDSSGVRGAAWLWPDNT